MDEKSPLSSSETPTGSIGLSSTESQSSDVPHLTYEETPVIEPAKEVTPPPSFETPQPKGRSLSFLKVLVGFIILFIAGFALSGVVRQMLSPKTETKSTGMTSPTPTPTVGVMTTSLPRETTPSGVLQGMTGWKTYAVVNGLTRKPIENVSFQLPSDVIAPTCDGTNCASQGTYLPGGTRFTVAPRGTGQALADYRSRIISDLRGNAFTVKETTLNGKKTVEFMGTFAGSTAQGFGFTRMHGFMVELTATTSLEMNHFTPSNVTADFEKDEVVFDQIVKTLSFTSAPVTIPTSTVIPTSTMAPSKTVTTGTSSATPTGIMLTK